MVTTPPQFWLLPSIPLDPATALLHTGLAPPYYTMTTHSCVEDAGQEYTHSTTGINM